MIRAVLDANVFISGVLGYRREESVPGAVLRAWYTKTFDLFISRSLINEIERNLGKPYMVRSIDLDDLQTAIEALNQQTKLVEITHHVSGIASHPEDDLVLAAAVSAEVDYLVTGDKMLLQLGSFQNVTLVSPRQFLALIDLATTQDL